MTLVNPSRPRTTSTRRRRRIPSPTETLITRCITLVFLAFTVSFLYVNFWILGDDGESGGSGGGKRHSLRSATEVFLKSEISERIHAKFGNRMRGVHDNKNDSNNNNNNDPAQREENKKDNNANMKEEELTEEFLYEYVNSIRKPKHEVITVDKDSNPLPYDVNDCPETPPDNYPYEWPMMDLLSNWLPDDTTTRPKIHQGLCRFDFRTELHKAQRYREAEVPFLIRDDPQILSVVHRWNSDPNYLSRLLGPDISYKTEYSKTNHLMYAKPPPGNRKGKGGGKYPDWEPPIEVIKMTYDEFLLEANRPPEFLTPDSPHYYFRVNAKDKSEQHFLFHELPFFQSSPNFYIVDPNDTRGINCRFGMTGNVAESHFDGSRNFVALFGGERRYVLNHPKNCGYLALYPRGHPSGRHTSLDWSDLEDVRERSGEFVERAEGNEVVLQAGDVLYLPTFWMHHIVSLELNWQCNARSGITDDYAEHIQSCGF